MKTINERLRDLREDHDLSQKQIAAVMGITQQLYSKYELGIHQIPLHHLVALAQYYDVSLDYLAGRIDADCSSAGNIYVTRTCTSNDLIRRVLSLTQEGRDRAVDYISLLQLKYKER